MVSMSTDGLWMTRFCSAGIASGFAAAVVSIGLATLPKKGVCRTLSIWACSDSGKVGTSRPFRPASSASSTPVPPDVVMIASRLPAALRPSWKIMPRSSISSMLWATITPYWRQTASNTSTAPTTDAV
ncbi:hypothetical protein D9M68_726620 [compost metagenome]